MKREFTLLGQNYDPDKHIVMGWMASEKLDGQRALWLPGCDFDFSDQQEKPTGLWSRDGKIIHAPQWWLDHLPPCGVDLELYMGHRSFQDTMSIVRRKIPGEEWRLITANAFDLPVKMEAGKIHFKHRELEIPDLHFNTRLSKQHPFRTTYNYMVNKLEENDIFRIIPQHRITSLEFLNYFLEEVESKGGEGLVLRDPSSKWVQGRNSCLLKLKPTKTMFVTVIGYYYGEGKYDGMMGALHVRSEDGTEFKLSGFTDEERRTESVGVPFKRSVYDDCFEFPRGKVIKITYRELTKDGVPKEARYARDN